MRKVIEIVAADGFLTGVVSVLFGGGYAVYDALELPTTDGVVALFSVLLWGGAALGLFSWLILAIATPHKEPTT